MRALVRTEEVRLVDVPDPRGEVIVDVAYAGVCRTDLAVADGKLGARGVILGHELSGRVGTRPVTVVPFVGERWLGVDVDGAFAERVAVPASTVIALPASLSMIHGAFVEPVAAAMGSLRWIERGARVLVAGSGRIAELSARIVATHARVEREAVGTFDVVIEHGSEPSLAALKPGGTLIVKSRARAIAGFDVGELVARELCVRGASHGSFEAAVDWLASGRIAIDDLLAAPRPLDAFEAVFAAARDEARKQMFVCAG